MLLTYESNTAEESVHQSIQICEKLALNRVLCEVAYRFVSFKGKQTVDKFFSVRGKCVIQSAGSELSVSFLSVEGDIEDRLRYCHFVIEDFQEDIKEMLIC